MDLPTCPACGQSILDDDVDDCPFCGAVLPSAHAAKPAKPKKKPRPAAKERAEKSEPEQAVAEKPAPPRATLKSLAAGSGDGADMGFDADAFEVDTLAAKRAVPVSRQRVKGRPFRVTCPMCDTVGFIPARAAGQDVRCANKECMVPIFTAPRLPRKPTTDSQAGKSGSSMQLLALVGGIVIALTAVGGAIYIFSGDEKIHDPYRGGTTTPPGPGPGPASDCGDGTCEGPEAPPVEETIRMVDLVPEILKAISNSTLDKDRNRSKPYCRRKASEAYAETGDIEAAYRHLQQLDKKFGSQYDFYHVPPLVAIAWYAIDAGQDDLAFEAVEAAWKRAQHPPARGRDRLDFTSQLATVLVAIGRTDEAQTLIDKVQDSGPRGQLSAYLQSVAAWGTYDLDEAITNGPMLPWSAPQAVAVTDVLSARGLWDEGLVWALDQTTPSARAECLSVWAAATTIADVPRERLPHGGDLAPAVEPLSPAGRATVFSRVAITWARVEKNDQARQALASAQTALATVPVPKPLAFPELKDAFDFKLPDRAPLELASRAAAEIGRVQMELGEREAAWKSVQTSLEFLRAMSPAPAAIISRIENGKADKANLERQLKQAFRDLPKNDVFKKRLRYLLICKDLKREADECFEIRSTLLSNVAEWGLGDELWKEIKTRSNDNIVDRREYYLGTSVPWILANSMRVDGNEALAGTIEKELASHEQKLPRRLAIRFETARLVDNGEYRKAGEMLSSYQRDFSWRALWATRLACRLVIVGELEPTFKLVSSINSVGDQVLREDVLELIAALATVNDLGLSIWSLLQDRSTPLPPTENVAIHCGLIAGVEELPKEAVAASPVEDETN